MVWVLAIIILVSAWHFVYEGAIAPTARMLLRNRVFRIRDDLRRVHIEDDRLDADLFSLLQDSLNSAIVCLDKIGLAQLVEFRSAMKRDESLRLRIEKRMKLVSECEIDRVKEIEAGLSKTLYLALLFNSGGWIVWLLCRGR